MDNPRGFYQTTIQPIINTIKHPVKGTASASQNYDPTISVKSHAKLVQSCISGAIDDRDNDLAKMLENYAQDYEKANFKDPNTISATIIKLFYKEPLRHDSKANAKDNSTIRHSDVTPEFIYDYLFKADERQGHQERQDHPHGISSIAFAFASILALSVFRDVDSQSDIKIEHNKASPYFDLSPLYGSNDTGRIRMNDGQGMLRPDSFDEDKRLDMLPDSVPALLVLWNRYHNYVAKQLFSHNEHNKWEEPAKLSLGQRSRQDNEIFNIARSITCIHFMNVVQEDFLRGLVGMPVACPSARLDVLYDVRDKGNHKNYLSSVESHLLYSFSSFTPPSFDSTIRERSRMKQTGDEAQRKSDHSIGLHRNHRERFEDNDLADILFNAIEKKAGGRTAPDWAREQEIKKLEQARESNVCTLNEFRERLGLKKLGSFEEWNPDLANTARYLYGNIDKLELYPGLKWEASTGSGFGFGYTMTWGLISDIVTRIRCDPIFTSKFNEHMLTKWGYKDSISTIDDSKGSNSCFHSTEGSLGGMLPKLFQRTLPHNCPYDNIYCLFPFVVPEKSKAYVEKLLPSDVEKYSIVRPKRVKIRVLKTLKAITKVLNDHETFHTPYKQRLMELTGGYGHMLGFDDLELHDRDLMVTLFSLMPDKGAVRRIGASFAQKARENLQRRRKLIGKGKNARIDVVKDVIDATCIRWVCETIYDFDFKDDFTCGKSKQQIEKAQKESQGMEEMERENFASFHAYLFRNTEPEFGWNARARALTASNHLRQGLENKLFPSSTSSPFIKCLYSVVNPIMDFIESLRSVAAEYVYEKVVDFQTPFTFQDRMKKASNIKPLKRLTVSGHHLFGAKKEINAKEESLSFFKRAWKGLEALFANPPDMTREHHAEHIANEELKKQRVIANVLALAIVMCVHFSKVCAQAVDFYLDDRYAQERQALVALCKDKSSSSQEIMGYIWEAYRIGQRFGLWRIAAGKDRKIIEQGLVGPPNVTIEPGDRIFADFTFAHNNPEHVEKPEKVKPDRKINSLLGLGLHKCPAGSLIDETMSQMIRVIFSQEGLKRADGEKGCLKSATLRPLDDAPVGLP
ncbi:heme peroxidase [Amanita rubescens]|nr:heme peroxidase [Amanita rubescens]